MITYKYKIENIVAYSVYRANEVVVISGKDYSDGYKDRVLNIYDEDFSSTLTVAAAGAYDIEIISDTIFFSTINPDRSFKLINNKITQLDFVLYLKGVYGTNSYFCLCQIKDSIGFVQISLVDLSILNFWPLPFGLNGIKVTFNSSFVSIKGSCFACIDFNSKAEKWRIDFNEIVVAGKVFGRVIFVNNGLYVYCKGIDERGVTFCIDASTGEIKRQFEDFAGNLYATGNKLYVSAYTFVKILDTTTNQITVIDLTTELQPFNLQIHWEKSVYTEDGFMCFVDGQFFTTNRFGIVDLNNKKLVWHGELEISDGVNNNIQEIRIENKRIYVHCSDNTLHVFEK